MKKNVCDGIMRKSLFEDSVGDLAVGIGMQIERKIKKTDNYKSNILIHC